MKFFWPTTEQTPTKIRQLAERSFRSKPKLAGSIGFRQVEGYLISFHFHATLPHVALKKEGRKMLIYPSMISESASQAGIKVPENPDGDWDPKEFPRFTVFCNAQLCRPLSSWDEHWGNAKIVASFDDPNSVTFEQLRKKGFQGI
jgi:hypothetical protein